MAANWGSERGAHFMNRCRVRWIVLGRPVGLMIASTTGSMRLEMIAGAAPGMTMYILTFPLIYLQVLLLLRPLLPLSPVASWTL